MEQQSGSRLETSSISTIQWVAMVLVALTGVLHVYAGVIEGAPPVGIAGVGFFGAIVLFLADHRRRLLYLIGIPYTAVQIPLWYAIKAGEYTMVGYVDKAIQVLLVVVLLYLYWAGRTDSSDADPRGTPN